MERAAFIEDWQPPDEDYLDLLDEAFLSFRIDPLQYKLAIVWIEHEFSVRSDGTEIRAN